LTQRENSTFHINNAFSSPEKGQRGCEREAKLQEEGPGESGGVPRREKGTKKELDSHIFRGPVEERESSEAAFLKIRGGVETILARESRGKAYGIDCESRKGVGPSKWVERLIDPHERRE